MGKKDGRRRTGEEGRVKKDGRRTDERRKDGPADRKTGGRTKGRADGRKDGRAERLGRKGVGDRKERVAASQGGKESDGDMVRFATKNKQQKRSI